METIELPHARPEQESPESSEQTERPHDSERSPDSPSRFGNRREIIKALDESPARVLGRLAEVFPARVKPSTNEVQATAVQAEHDVINEVEVVKLEDSEHQEFYAVFKPFSGENREIKESCAISALFLRELIAYRISEDLLKLDVSPPLTVRIINGQIGTLQLFMDSEKYATVDRLTASGFWDLEELEQHPDYASLALLDCTTLQCDRHDENAMVRVEEDAKGKLQPSVEEGQPFLISLDNALCLSLETHNRDPRMVGPMQIVTGRYGKHDSVEPLRTPIPEKLLEAIEAALEAWPEFITSIGSALEEEEDRQITENMREAPSLAIELEWARQRLEAMLQEKIFISRINTASLPTNITEKSPHPHPPFKKYNPAVEVPSWMVPRVP